MEIKANALVEYIESSAEVDPVKKAEYLEILSFPGVSKSEIAEVLDGLEDGIQKKIDGAYADAGVVLDENDPEYQKQYQLMSGEIEAAEQEFGYAMEEINGDMDGIEEGTAKKLDNIKIQSVMDVING